MYCALKKEIFLTENQLTQQTAFNKGRNFCLIVLPSFLTAHTTDRLLIHGFLPKTSPSANARCMVMKFQQ